MRGQLLVACYLLLDIAAVIIVVFNPFLFLRDGMMEVFQLRAYMGLAITFFVTAPLAFVWSRRVIRGSSSQPPGRGLYFLVSDIMIGIAWSILVVSAIMMVVLMTMPFPGVSD